MVADEQLWWRQEVQILQPTNELRTVQVTGTPTAVKQVPLAVEQNCIPRVISRTRELLAWNVAMTLGVTIDINCFDAYLAAMKRKWSSECTNAAVIYNQIHNEALL